MRLGSNKIFYVYSRKHGDLERDYNYFSMLPEFYSQDYIPFLPRLWEGRISRNFTV